MRNERPQKPSRLPRRAWFKLVVPLLSLAFVAAMIEAGLRLAGYDPIASATEGRAFFLAASPRPDLEYTLVPGTSGRAWGCAVSIDSLGFRDREYARRKPDGVYRILIIGDSVTFGNRLSADDTYPEQLEAMCARAGENVEVLNLGVGGYDTLNEVAFLESRGQDLDADRVVVGFCINDAGVHSANLSYVRFLERCGALVRASRLVQLVSVRFDRAAALREFETANRDDVFAERYAGRIASLDDDPEVQRMIASVDDYLEEHPRGPRLPYASWYASPDRVGRLRYAFDRLCALSTAGGYEVTVLIIPLLDEEGHAPLYDSVYAIVAHEARRAGFDVLNARDTFQAAGMERLMQIHERRPDPIHPHAGGHEMLARLLHDHLFGDGADVTAHADTQKETCRRSGR